jgi:hypothetical protein
MSCYLSHANPPLSPPPPHHASVAPSAAMLSGLAEGRLLPPPPLTPPPHGWICVVFSVLGQKRGWPLFRDIKVLQLDSDSFCDHVRIRSEVIGHLWAELGFWFFPRKWWKSMRPQIFGQDADILASRAGTTAGTVRERRRPYKLGGLSAHFNWGLHGGETTSPDRELFSQTWKKSEVGDSAEPK